MTFTAALAGAPFGSLAKKLGKKTRKAFHGSPHEFDAFDLKKIGTGEGAQAYGHGLYFTSKDDIAKFYRDTLTNHGMGGRKLKGSLEDTRAKVREGLEAHFQGLDEKIQVNRAKDQFLYDEKLENEWLNADWARKQIDTDYYNDRERLARALEDGRFGDFGVDSESLLEKDAGRLYQVEIPDESLMLDWDKPLSEQPEGVRKAVAPLLSDYDSEFSKWYAGHREKFGSGPSVDELDERMLGNYRRMFESATGIKRPPSSGQGLYYSLGGDEAASAKLRELGIPGITYKGATSGERNFVMFDDEMINLLERGMALPGAMAAAGVGGAVAGATGGAVGALSGNLGQQAWNALPQQNEQPWHQGHSAGDWAKAVPDAGMDFLNALVRPSAVGGATVLDYLHGWPAEKMDQRAAARDERIDYQPRTELGAKLSDRGGDVMMNVLADLIRPMMPSPYTQRQLEAFMGKAEKTAPRELRALGGAADYLDWIF